MFVAPLLSLSPLQGNNKGFSEQLMSWGILEGQLCANSQETINKLEAIYNKQSQSFSDIICAIKNNDKKTVDYLIHDFKEKNYGVYPALYVFVQDEKNIQGGKTIALEKGGSYSGTITRVSLFSRYLKEQLDNMFEEYHVTVYVGLSQISIPFVFLSGDINKEFNSLSAHDRTLLKPLIHLPHLGEIHDDIPNGQWNGPYGKKEDNKYTGSSSWASPKESSFPMGLQTGFSGETQGQKPSSSLINRPSPGSSVYPLMSFSALRTDYSLGRLQHYCGTAPEMFQDFVLLTNYQRYIDGFFTYAQSQEARDKGYTHWCEPKDQVQSLCHLTSHYHRDAGHTFQMPAYHLMKPNNQGITIINIGVSPSNAKTITDHLAVLRGHCWIMLGHCGGFNPSQRLGDYVLASNYMRADHVLDGDIARDIPIPVHNMIHEIILEEGRRLMGIEECQRCFHYGTVLSTGNRNWELQLSEFAPLIHRSRSIAIDMESTTLGANAYRFMVPYGTLLCISDRPLHGELKLSENAKSFYDEKVQHHLRLGLYTMESLGQKNLKTLHQENYRGIYAPPLR